MPAVVAHPAAPKHHKKGNALLFLVDTTQSMHNWITAVRTILAEVVDISTMTNAFDALAVMEYGDYDSVWCSQAHVKNTFNYCPTGGDEKENDDGIVIISNGNKDVGNEAISDAIPVRFSGWGVLGAEAKRSNVVVNDSARVSVDDVHQFTAQLRARGGGRVPEAVKTALKQIAIIGRETLSPQCRLHVIHLTDAPMHLDVKALDGEGRKEKAAFLNMPFQSVNPPLPNQLDQLNAFSLINVLKDLLDSFAISAEEMDRFNVLVKAEEEEEKQSSNGTVNHTNNAATSASDLTSQSSSSSQKIILRPSRLHYTCVCNKPLIAGPYALIAHFTGGNLVAPPDIEVNTLRDVIQSILNSWMGVHNKKKNAGGNDTDILRGNVCHLMFKTKRSIDYVPSSSPSTAVQFIPRVMVEIPMDLSDDKIDSLCKARRHSAPSTASNGTVTVQNVAGHEPVIVVQPSLRHALRRCLALVATNNGEKSAGASAQVAFLHSIRTVLRRLCSKSPMALCSSPPLGKIWRAFSRRRDDPMRDELLNWLQNSTRELTNEADKVKMAEWLAESFNHGDEIKQELKQFVQREGVKGLVKFEGLDEINFVPQSLSNAFASFDTESQAQIMAILARMRVDRSFVVDSVAEAAIKKRAMNADEGMVGDDENSAPQKSKNITGSGTASFFIDVQEGDDELGLFAEDCDDDDDITGDDDEDTPLPFPPNAVPLNLPLPVLFRVLLSTAVPGTQLTRRPAALVAALALRSGSVLRVPAALHLQSICGQWISGEMIASPKPTPYTAQNSGTAPSGGVPPAPLAPLIPQNFVGTFMRVLLSSEKSVADMQAKHKESLLSAESGDGKKPVSAAATNRSHMKALLTGRILTASEFKSFKQLLRLQTLLRTDDWEVTANIIDVESADGVVVDYVLKCNLCKKDRPWSLVDDEGICGYCHFRGTDEGTKHFGPYKRPDPKWRPPPPSKAKPSAPNKKGSGHQSSSSSAPAKANTSSAAATAPLIAPHPAPAAAESTGTYQVRCGCCFGYYSRDRSRTITGAHRCFYCREATAEESTAQRERLQQQRTELEENKSDDATTRHVDPNDNDNGNCADFPHVKICKQCNARIIGAPTRPLPFGGICACCCAKNQLNEQKKNDAAVGVESAPAANLVTTSSSAIATSTLTFGTPAAGAQNANLRRSQTTTDRPTRLARLFPYRLFWRDISAAVGLVTVPEWSSDVVDRSFAPLQHSLTVAAQAFDIPMITSGVQMYHNQSAAGGVTDALLAPPNDDEPQLIPNTAMPPNRFVEEQNIRRNHFMMTLQQQPRRTGHHRATSHLAPTSTVILPIEIRRALTLNFNPFTAVENISEVWENLVDSVFNTRFGGDTTYCALCCQEFSHGAGASALHPACGRKGCDQRMCYECGKEWYGAENNKIGHVLAPRRLFCPCCSRIPTAKVLKIHHPDAAYVGLPSQVAALNTDAFYIAWCRTCVKPREFFEKVCAENMEHAQNRGPMHPLNRTNYECDTCVSKNFKPIHKCPFCSVPTYRVSGCFHMTCTCGGHWCYECGDKLSEHNPYDHHCTEDRHYSDGEPDGEDEYFY